MQREARMAGSAMRTGRMHDHVEQWWTSSLYPLARAVRRSRGGGEGLTVKPSAVGLRATSRSSWCMTQPHAAAVRGAVRTGTRPAAVEQAHDGDEHHHDGPTTSPRCARSRAARPWLCAFVTASVTPTASLAVWPGAAAAGPAWRAPGLGGRLVDQLGRGSAFVPASACTAGPRRPGRPRRALVARATATRRRSFRSTMSSTASGWIAVSLGADHAGTPPRAVSTADSSRSHPSFHPPLQGRARPGDPDTPGPSQHEVEQLQIIAVVQVK